MSFNPWPKGPQRVKNAVPTAVNGHAFPSKMEAAVYHYLLKRECVGEIRDIQMQQTIVLQGGDRETRITWRIDFSCVRKADGELIYVEAKGFPTEVYKLKLKVFMWNAQQGLLEKPGELEVYGGSYSRIQLTHKISKGGKNELR